MRRQVLQTTLFPEISRPAAKPEPAPLEKDLMRQLMTYAKKIGLPNVHVETFCNNAFNVQCPVCGNSTLAHCRKIVNKESAGLPDILGIKFGIEVKRHANYEPSPLQTATHEALKRQGIPCMTVNPENTNEAIGFFRNLSKRLEK